MGDQVSQASAASHVSIPKSHLSQRSLLQLKKKANLDMSHCYQDSQKSQHKAVELSSALRKKRPATATNQQHRSKITAELQRRI